MGSITSLETNRPFNHIQVRTGLDSFWTRILHYEARFVFNRRFGSRPLINSARVKATCGVASARRVEISTEGGSIVDPRNKGSPLFIQLAFTPIVALCRGTEVLDTLNRWLSALPDPSAQQSLTTSLRPVCIQFASALRSRLARKGERLLSGPH